jgi:hypothetical protein
LNAKLSKKRMVSHEPGPTVDNTAETMDSEIQDGASVKDPRPSGIFSIINSYACTAIAFRAGPIFPSMKAIMFTPE